MEHDACQLGTGRRGGIGLRRAAATEQRPCRDLSQQLDQGAGQGRPLRFDARRQHLPEGSEDGGRQAAGIEELSDETVVLTNREPPPVDDPEIQRCVDVVEEALGVEVLDDTQLGEEDVNYWAGATGGCRLLAIFEQIATAAGDDLTTESFTAAIMAGRARIRFLCRLSSANSASIDSWR